MPDQFTTFADTRAVGTGNPPDDANQLVRSVNALGAKFSVANAAYAGGAAPSASAAQNTAAINAADVAAAAAGGIVTFPPGTYAVNAGLVKKTAAHWQGAGRNGTILQLAASQNAPILVSDSFASLTMTGSVTSGVSAFAIRDMTFDGNAASQGAPAAAGMQIYGCDYLLENVSIRNFLAADGLYTEFGPAGGSGLPDKSMESMFRFLRIHDSTLTGAGWHNRGPHDSNVYGCWIYQNTANAIGYWAETTPATYTATGLSGTAVSSTPATITLNTTLNLPAAGTVTMPSAGGTVTITYTGVTATTMTGCSAAGGSGNYSSNVVTPPQFSATSCSLFGLHVWGSHNIAVVNDTATAFVGCDAEGATTGQVLTRGIGNASWTGGRIFNPTGNTSYGLQVGDTANQSGAFRLSGAQIIGFQGATSAKAYINVVNEGSSRYEALLSLSGTAQAVFGTFSVASYHKLVFEGGGSTTPSVAYQSTGAGTSPPASPTVSNATDRRASVLWGTGTGATAGTQVRVTFAQPKPGTPKIGLVAENTLTASFAPYVSNFSSTSVDIGFGLAPTSSQGATVYQVGIFDATG
jgi:hypothetical protein